MIQRPHLKIKKLKMKYVLLLASESKMKMFEFLWYRLLIITDVYKFPIMTLALVYSLVHLFNRLSERLSYASAKSKIKLYKPVLYF